MRASASTAAAAAHLSDRSELAGVSEHLIERDAAEHGEVLAVVVLLDDRAPLFVDPGQDHVQEFDRR